MKNYKLLRLINRSYWSRIMVSLLLLTSANLSDLLASQNSAWQINDLLKLVESNRITKLKEILSTSSKNELILDDNSNGETPLTLAAKLGHIEIVSTLLAHNANIDQVSATSATPLMKATFAGHSEVVKLLIANKANLRLEHNNGFEAFDWALENGNSELMKLLIIALNRSESTNDRHWLNFAFGISSTMPDTKIASASVSSFVLLAAVINDDLERLSQLLESKINPNIHNVTGYAPLPMAVRLNRVKIVDRLLTSGADVNLGNNGNDEASAINQAARAGNLILLKKLVDAGALVNKPNARGYTALHLASLKQAKECVLFLLSKQANPEFANIDGFTAFDFAYQTGNATLVAAYFLNALTSKQKLAVKNSLKNKTNNSILSDFDNPGVMFASILFDHPIWLESKLPKAKSLVNTKLYGYFPLNISARFGKLEITRLLIESGALVNRASESGYKTTPLIDSARQIPYSKISEFLISNQADIHQGDKNGDPVINWSTYYGHHEQIKMLLKLGANPLQANNEGYTALRTARERGHKEILKTLKKSMTNDKEVYKEN